MGLESINFLFLSEVPIEEKLTQNKSIKRINEKKFVYNDQDFWIDIEIEGLDKISLRIALCNPTRHVVLALRNFILYLFESNNGQLLEMRSRKKFSNFNLNAQIELEHEFLNQKKVFEQMYGNYTAAISAEEFYKRQK